MKAVPNSIVDNDLLFVWWQWWQRQWWLSGWSPDSIFGTELGNLFFGMMLLILMLMIIISPDSIFGTELGDLLLVWLPAAAEDQGSGAVCRDKVGPLYGHSSLHGQSSNQGERKSLWNVISRHKIVLFALKKKKMWKQMTKMLIFFACECLCLGEKLHENTTLLYIILWVLIFPTYEWESLLQCDCPNAISLMWNNK